MKIHARLSAELEADEIRDLHLLVSLLGLAAPLSPSEDAAISVITASRRPIPEQHHLEALRDVCQRVEAEVERLSTAEDSEYDIGRGMLAIPVEAFAQQMRDLRTQQLGRLTALRWSLDLMVDSVAQVEVALGKWYGAEVYRPKDPDARALATRATRERRQATRRTQA